MAHGKSLTLRNIVSRIRHSKDKDGHVIADHSMSQVAHAFAVKRAETPRRSKHSGMRGVGVRAPSHSLVHTTKEHPLDKKARNRAANKRARAARKVNR